MIVHWHIARGVQGGFICSAYQDLKDVNLSTAYVATAK
jgi:hypothetical protein